MDRQQFKNHGYRFRGKWAKFTSLGRKWHELPSTVYCWVTPLSEDGARFAAFGTTVCLCLMVEIVDDTTSHRFQSQILVENRDFLPQSGAAVGILP